MTARRVLAALLVPLLVALPRAGAGAQQSPEQRLREQRDELDRIRRERDSLQAEARALQGRVSSLSEHVANLRKQAEATTRLVRSLDRQLVTINADVKTANARLAQAQSEVGQRRGALRTRVRDIYKRGPLFATEALLAAKSFGELIARYKYLHELALYDRVVVRRVEDLYKQIESQRQLLVRLQDELARNREEKSREEQRLKDLEAQNQRTLVQTRQSAQRVQSRLLAIQRDEARVAQFIEAAEAAERREAGAGADAPSPTASSLRADDVGKLAWPVEGSILYNFGRAVNPNNTAIRWNGIGIAAPQGTAVRALADGEVMLADAIGTYGLTVILQHGGGDYSVYGSLLDASVAKGDRVSQGQPIGTVGRADPDMEPHLHLEIRPQGRAMDPLAWLRNRPN
jgi:septal ring factor EnvC (AmiA/AmiB activator)